MIKDVFTSGEVADICRASLQTVNRWLNARELKGYRPTKNADWRITRKELMIFMKDNGIPLEFITGDKIKVLIVDDEIRLLKAIVRAFRDEERFQIEIAHSGFSAGAKIEQFKPDVVILDIYLGDIDGREFLKYIREHPELSNTKVIGISGVFDFDEMKLTLDLGFNEFLQKPFEMEKLKQTIFSLFE